MAIVELDATGLFCPEPVMLLHKKIREVAVGDQIKVVATDPSTERDIVKFCTFLEHKLIESSKDANHFYFVIEKS